MDAVTAIDAVEKIVGLKVVDKIYDDLVSKPLQKVGTVFETLFDTANGFLEPLKFYTEKRKLTTLINLKKLQAEADKIPDQNVIPAHPEIAAPILDRLSYVSNEELSNAFIKLLTSASNSDTVGTAHPGFIHMIDRLSPDDAKLLKFLIDNPRIPSVTLRYYPLPPEPERNTYNPNPTFIYVQDSATWIEHQIDFQFPKNSTLYLENLVSLGLLEFKPFVDTDNPELYANIETELREKLATLKMTNPKFQDGSNNTEPEYGNYYRNNLCDLFLKACI